MTFYFIKRLLNILHTVYIIIKEKNKILYLKRLKRAA